MAEAVALCRIGEIIQMKISKKIFACVLTVCMLLTMFAGVLSANAAVTGSATIGTLADPVTAGTASVNVPVTLTATEAIGGADLYIAFPEEVTAVSAVVAEGYADSYSIDYLKTEGNADLTDGVAHFVLLAEDADFAGATTVEITLTIGTAELAAGKYDITIAEGTLIGTTSEIEVDVPVENITNGGFTVAAEACKHDETKEVVTKEATCAEAGTMNIVCVACDAIVNEGVVIPATGEHNYVDGACTVCGAEDPNYVPPVTGPVLDETIAPGAHSVSIGDTFGIGFRFDLSTISDDYASFRLDFNRTSADNSYNFTYVETSYDTFAKNTNGGLLICTTTYYGIQLFSLTAPIEYTLHCFDADGNEVAYSETFTTTLADVAVAYHDSTSNVKIKKALADLIQVGAAALNHFTSNRTKACDYSTLPIPTIESDYITTELGEMATYNSQEGEIALTITGGLKDSFYYNMRFGGNIANKEQYRYEISFYHATQKKTVTYDVDSSAMVGNATTISTSFTTFPLFGTNADVTFTLYQNDVVVGTAHYCLEKYISDTMASTSSATLRTVLQELGELAQSFRSAKGI